MLELREFHCISHVSQGVKDAVQEGQIVTVYDEGKPRGLWRIGMIEEVITGSDGRVRSASVRVQSKSGRDVVLRRPMQHLYPLEANIQRQSTESHPEETDDGAESHEPVKAPQNGQLRRSAAVQARDRILGCMTD